MEEQKIKVLALLPMELPKEIDLDNILEAMQKFVGDVYKRQHPYSNPLFLPIIILRSKYTI